MGLNIGVILGIMEKKMETIGIMVIQGYIGIMEKKMETTITIIGYTGFYWGYIGDNGKENGNYYIIMGIILGVI